jgi:hypothetical protein
MTDRWPAGELTVSPGAETEMNSRRPSGLNATLLVAVYPSNVKIFWPFVTFHTFTV